LEDIRKLDELFLLSRDLLDENSGLELIRKLLLYIYGAKDIQPEVLFDRVERIAPEKGVEKGIRQGMQKGKTEGLRQGIKEKAYDAARRMLSKGYPMEDIAEITGLSEEDIQRL
jgi:predicted transposase/invertase (TIGR01784 family)